jgi:hypothetical protein
MTKEFTQSEVRSLLRGYLENRPDLGLGEVASGMVLEPANPFEREAPRPPRKAFVLAVFCLLALLVVFVYFNLWSCP